MGAARSVSPRLKRVVCVQQPPRVCKGLVQGDAVREDQHRLLPPLLPQTRETSAKVSGLRVRLFIATRSQKVYSCLQFPDSWLNRYKTFFATPTCRARFVVTRVPCIICLSCCPIALIFRVTVVNLQRTQSLVTKKRILDLEQMYFYHVGPRTQSLVTKMGFGILNPKP